MSKIEIAKLWCRTKHYQSKLAQSRQVVREALETKLKYYIAVSGGKDSTVVYNLVKEQSDCIFGVWSDEEFYLPETKEYIDSLDNVHQVRDNQPHCKWFKTEGDYERMPDYPYSLGCRLAFIGLRKQENSRRRIYLNKNGMLHYVKKYDQWSCNPIANWTWEDVWTYIHSNKLDYNRAYDVLDRIGIHPGKQRIGPFANRLALGYGQLAILKRGWPNEFNRFAAKYPEARSYV